MLLLTILQLECYTLLHFKLCNLDVRAGQLNNKTERKLNNKILIVNLNNKSISLINYIIKFGVFKNYNRFIVIGFGTRIIESLLILTV